MDLAAYLRRIGFASQPRPDLVTLRRLQRAHLQQIPFENLDIHLGRRLTLAPEAAFAKLVTGGRGGWCYEMNGLFCWALESIGFRVTPVTGAVMRAERGPNAIGNHLALSVELDELYLVELGLGDGPTEPIPLREGTYRQQWRTLRLERVEDSWWRFHNYPYAFNRTMDFRPGPIDWDAVAQKCAWLQASPDSRLAQTAVCLRHTENSIVALIGRVLRRVDQKGMVQRLVSPDEYAQILGETFGIRLPEASELWPRIARRHDALFATNAPSPGSVIRS